MFSTYLALAALPLTLVHGLTISNPTETVTSTGPITISWQTSSGDPSVFSIELINQSFNSQYAIANNVDSSLGSLSLTFPRSLPSADGYTIELVNISNINNIYAQTGTFSVSEPVSSSASGSSTGSASASGSVSASGSASASSGSASA
ncbi:Ser-Thr-rich glycosyl-phosphatidyl-inositol-anchored membrane family-domain-containing protein [Armillaria borealis]|uniref:Ser-Thr-rich glycosyl-phosphatidyl-inositol-anchored membrane family-domain-containing protein n=1 Tax=Armillaria borealis TaxID=47425 RepID=A0AA39MIG0_9AGAR|nr:Ser-Thr-rich glycosyl-phosphatidyl-inositol-anchored membrane family-domain-containing protein [Armillaria borealis]